MLSTGDSGERKKKGGNCSWRSTDFFLPFYSTHFHHFLADTLSASIVTSQHPSSYLILLTILLVTQYAPHSSLLPSFTFLFSSFTTNFNLFRSFHSFNHQRVAIITIFFNILELSTQHHAHSKVTPSTKTQPPRYPITYRDLLPMLMYSSLHPCSLPFYPFLYFTSRLLHFILSN